MRKILFFAALTCTTFAYSQNVAINASGAAPVTSAMLDIASTTSGLLIPRMTAAQIAAIGSPATSLLVYQTDAGTQGAGFYFYNGSAWVPFSTNNGGWGLLGNTGTNGTTNFIGTTDAQHFRMFTSNTERIRLTSAGYFGIQTTNPQGYFHIAPAVAIGTFQSMFDNTLAGDAAIRIQHTSISNGSRVVLSVTNYSASAFQSPGLMGLSIQTTGNGGVGVQGVCNGPAQVGVYAGNQNALAATSGWGLYSNNYSGGATPWYNVSDGRLKKDIVSIPDPIQKLKALRGVEYYFDQEKYSDINLPTNKQYGFIAQEVEQVMPEIVRESVILGNTNQKVTADMNSPELKTYNFKTMSYTYIIPVLVEAMKAQQTKIEALEQQVKELKEKK